MRDDSASMMPLQAIPTPQSGTFDFSIVEWKKSRNSATVRGDGA